MSDSPLKLYRPSNGTEGNYFMDEFCHRCEKDREWREDEKNPCQILSKTLFLGVSDAGYPREWCYVNGSPTCTAFEPERVAAFNEGAAAAFAENSKMRDELAALRTQLAQAEKALAVARGLIGKTIHFADDPLSRSFGKETAAATQESCFGITPEEANELRAAHGAERGREGA